MTLGDEICVNTECFNFIRYDNDNIVMLSKWNLNVGNNPKGEETFKQDSDVIGFSPSAIKYGNVRFSWETYWYDNNTGTLKEEYGNSYPTDVYRSTYNAVPDFSGNDYYIENYSIAYYVERYKNILEQMGLTVQEARLLTYYETTDSSVGIGCTPGDYDGTCPSDSFILNTSFWIGSAVGYNGIWGVISSGLFRGGRYDDSSGVGVRPVIVISKDEV